MPLKQRKPLRRKCSLRDSFIRKLKAEGKTQVWNKNGKSLKKKPLKKQSRSRRREMGVYFASAKEWFEKPENYNCRVCERLREDGEDIPILRATERHHLRGRIGRLLNWEPGWVPCCLIHRSFPHDFPSRARRLGLLAESKDWNVYPRGERTAE